MNWDQFRTILWLRWRLSRNQFGRAGFWNTVVTVLATIFGIAFGIGGCIGGFIGGYVGLREASPQLVLLVWDVVIGVFLFFWMIGLVAEIQRSESIDIGKLLHLPVSLRDVFVINFVASHFTPSVILIVPAMMGLAAGLTGSRGAWMLLLFPLLLGFLFMVSAWTYCLRGWLSALMINPRRRRTIVIGITTVFVLLGQLPNLYFNLAHRDQEERKGSQPHETHVEASSPSSVTTGRQFPPSFLAAHSYVPLLWVSKGALELTQRNALSAILGIAGTLGIGVLGLSRAYLGTQRFYMGKSEGRKTTPRRSQTGLVESARAGGTRTILDRELPWLPEEAAAFALASFRSITRAPEVRMAMVSAFVMMVVLGTILLPRAAKSHLVSGKPFVVTASVFFVMMGMVQLMFNQFGVDRNGFRSIVLLPARRRYILLGKNLALAPIVIGAGLIALMLLKLFIGIDSLDLLAGVLQMVIGFLLMSIAGNLVSIVAPYRIAAGSLRATKTPLKTTLVIALSHLFFPVVLIPAIIPATVAVFAGFFGIPPVIPVNLLLSAVLAIVIAVVYGLSLAGLGEMLQRREIGMLEILTREVE